VSACCVTAITDFMPQEFPNLHRSTRYAKRIRAELIEQLGGRCALCGEDDEGVLEFDHPFGRDWTPNRLSYSSRMARYKREADAKLLRLLCADCNLSERKRNDNGVFVPTNAAVPLTQPLEAVCAAGGVIRFETGLIEFTGLFLCANELN
jgi:hypothetical protein